MHLASQIYASLVIVGRTTHPLVEAAWGQNRHCTAYKQPQTFLEGVRHGVLDTTLKASPHSQQQHKQEHKHETIAEMRSNMKSHRDLPVDVLIIGITGGIGSGKSTACRMVVSDLCANATNKTDSSPSMAAPAAAVHLDADSIAHGLYQRNSPVVTAIVNAFGPDVVLDTGEVNRPALGALIFNNVTARKQLEQIVWPLTRQEVWKRIQSFAITHSNATSSNYDRTTSTTQSQAGTDDCREQETSTSKSTPTSVVVPPIIIVEAALLLEAGWDDMLDALWVITASREVALDRLVHGPRALTLEDAQRRMAAQESRPGMSHDSLEQEVKRGVVTAMVNNNGTPGELRHALNEALNGAKLAWCQNNKQQA